MSLPLLPDLVYPVTKQQFDPLMTGVVQLNMIDGCLTEKHQRGLALSFHTFDLWCKSKGRIDYRGRTGHEWLIRDAMTFCGPGNPVATRHKDMEAAHLTIDFHDCQMRLKRPASHCCLPPSTICSKPPKTWRSTRRKWKSAQGY